MLKLRHRPASSAAMASAAACGRGVVERDAAAARPGCACPARGRACPAGSARRRRRPARFSPIQVPPPDPVAPGHHAGPLRPVRRRRVPGAVQPSRRDWRRAARARRGRAGSAGRRCTRPRYAAARRSGPASLPISSGDRNRVSSGDRSRGDGTMVMVIGGRYRNGRDRAATVVLHLRRPHPGPASRRAAGRGLAWAPPSAAVASRAASAVAERDLVFMGFAPSAATSLAAEAGRLMVPSWRD